MHWNLMNDAEIVSIELLKLKHRKGNQIIQTSCKIGSPRNWVTPLKFEEIPRLCKK